MLPGGAGEELGFGAEPEAAEAAGTSWPRQWEQQLEQLLRQHPLAAQDIKRGLRQALAELVGRQEARWLQLAAGSATAAAAEADTRPAGDTSSLQLDAAAADTPCSAGSVPASPPPAEPGAEASSTGISQAGEGAAGQQDVNEAVQLEAALATLRQGSHVQRYTGSMHSLPSSSDRASGSNPSVPDPAEHGSCCSRSNSGSDASCQGDRPADGLGPGRAAAPAPGLPQSRSCGTAASSSPPWSEDEQALFAVLLRQHQRELAHGSQQAAWRRIAALMPGRSPQELHRRYAAGQQQRLQQHRRADLQAACLRELWDFLAQAEAELQEGAEQAASAAACAAGQAAHEAVRAATRARLELQRAEAAGRRAEAAGQLLAAGLQQAQEEGERAAAWRLEQLEKREVAAGFRCAAGSLAACMRLLTAALLLPAEDKGGCNRVAAAAG
jgi:hypothetical protein